MRYLNVAWTRFVLGALLIVVSACTAVVVEDPGPTVIRPVPGPRLCTREYDPVCARRGGDRRTFGNDCLAEEAGYRVLSGGECGFDRPREEPRERSCSRQYDPVCARRRGSRQTFSNSCLAEEAGYRVVRGGPCRDDGEIGDDASPRDRACTREYRPVCARRGANVRTFGNACEARSAEYRVITDGPC